MATIYKINDVLHGCDVVETIFNNAVKMKYSGKNIESYIYLVGCYAGGTFDGVLLYYWRKMRKLYNDGFTVASLHEFGQLYNMACCRLHRLFGMFVWRNTLTFGVG